MAGNEVRYSRRFCGLHIDLPQSRWLPEFQERRRFDYKAENKRYVEEWARETQAQPFPDSSLVRFFMRGANPSDVCSPETELVDRFCRGINLAGLLEDRVDGDDGPLQKVASLDERGCQDGVEYVRANNAPKSARELYYSLLRPVRPDLLPPRFLRHHNAKMNPLTLRQALPCRQTLPGSDRRLESNSR